MKSWSLVKRWVFYQALITCAILVITLMSVEKLVHLGVGAGIKASVQIVKKQILTLNPEALKRYFLKVQPPFVGLYDKQGHSIYLPEDDLPSNIKDINTSTKLYEKKYLLYVERLDNGFYLLGFTSQERLFYIEEYITKTMTILMFVLFIISSSLAYLILKRLYQPVEKLSFQMNQALDQMTPIYLEKNDLEDPKIAKLIEVYNQLIETIKNQFSRLEKKQKQLILILETLEEGICLITKNKQINFVNPQGYFYLKSKEARTIHDLCSHSFLGEKIQELLDPSVAKPLKEKCVDNHRYYELTLKNILDDQQLVIIYDETDRIEKLESGKTFISNASHELRTPITIIKGFAEAISDKEALKHISLDEVMPKILAACDRMDALIKRLLLLADVDQRSLELQSFDIAHVLKQEVAMFKNLDQDADIHYVGPESASIKGDEDLLKIVFSNLLSNGLKYSLAPKKITVSLNLTQDEYIIHFKDNGLGIPEGDLDKVFERFYRVDKARSRKMGGAGLGLSLVKTIIDKHRGSIRVESLLGSGSDFIVKIPNL
jgi:signal transduction histidine kinase